MVRSSGSKSTKSKTSPAAKTTATKPSQAAEKAASAARTGRTKQAKPDDAVSKKASASTARKTSAPTRTKATESSKKAATPAESKHRAPARNKETARGNENKTKLKTPRTPELFEDVGIDADMPNVSILPELTDQPADPEQALIALSTPPEFSESTVPSFSEAVADADTTKIPVVEKEVTFGFLGFNDQILDVVRKQNFEKPTRVQALCLPHTLDGKDVAGFAQTGTGKTAVYLLTAAHRLLNQENRVLQPHKPHVLVVVPTRELADQVSQDAKKLLAPLKLRSLALFGGVDVEKHVSELNQSVDIVVATPGRLIDLHRSKNLELDDLQLLVIDECDRMFDMGFIDDVEYVLRHLPAERVQKLMFSATGSEKVKELAFEYLENPEYIETDPVRITPERISQTAFAVTAEQKFLALMGHLRTNNPECAIIFTNTKVVAEWVGYKLASNGLNAEVLTGDLPQRKRMTLIKKIKEGKCNLLVATDVLSRGLHVANLSHVYNFDIPDDAESFIHRIGRTARAGATGHAISLICEDYGYNMGAVEKLLGFKIPLLDVPGEYLQAEDVSDYPFDENGRVKVFGQTTTSPATHRETADHLDKSKRRDRHAPESRPTARLTDAPEIKNARPEPALAPQHPRHDVSATRGQHNGHAQPKSAEGPRPVSAQPVSAASASAVAAGPVSTAGSAAHPRTQQPHGQRPAGQSTQASARPHAHAAVERTSTSGHRPGPSATPSPTLGTGSLPRRDDKARETIEMAIQAAKKAAAKRQKPTSAAGSPDAHVRAGVPDDKRPRVTTQIDEFAAAVINSAQERLGGTFGNIQDRIVSRLEENFPRLSETLIRLGFFSKRFTDDR